MGFRVYGLWGFRALGASGVFGLSFSIWGMRSGPLNWETVCTRGCACTTTGKSDLIYRECVGVIRITASWRICPATFFTNRCFDMVSSLNYSPFKNMGSVKPYNLQTSCVFADKPSYIPMKLQVPMLLIGASCM